jgi:hypothetical protein
MAEILRLAFSHSNMATRKAVGHAMYRKYESWCFWLGAYLCNSGPDIKQIQICAA